MNNIILRNALIDDELLLYKWRNINELVVLSSKQKKVTFNEHKIWFRKKIQDSNCKILIIQLNEEDIGLIRLEKEDKINCRISIYLLPGHEGQGHGYVALSKVINSGIFNCKSYFAEVQNKNIPSQKFFKKLGFSISSTKDKKSILFRRNNLPV